MKIVTSPLEMQRLAEAARKAGERIALVPTMGYLHQGHLSLMREGRRRATLLIASIFVNPTQFGPREDLTRYPRDLPRDIELMSTVPVDVLFAPEADSMYTASAQTWVEVSELTRGLCGAARPGHFRGVTTVVAKLFNLCKPHLALFGAKDFQQLRAIERMVEDLNFDTTIVAMPIVREVDGLAMSSRNAYLTPAERISALSLNRALRAAVKATEGGEAASPQQLSELVKGILRRDPSVQAEYVEVTDAITLEPARDLDEPVLLAIAARVGKTRLIDNVVISKTAGSADRAKG